MAETILTSNPGNDPRRATASLHVEVIADLVCPFSFIGKRRLDQALHSVQGPREVNWHPYQLNPDMPPAGLAFDVYLSQRFGPEADLTPVLDYLTKEGRSVGIDFHFDALQHVPNTLALHQLMQHAETLGADISLLADDLFDAFFVQGRNIGERNVIRELAGRHGIASAEVDWALENDNLQKVVLSREAQVRASGLAGLPGFLINRRLMVVGAQEKEQLVNAFDRAMFGEGTDSLESPALH